jgi:hypothetical protein
MSPFFGLTPEYSFNTHRTIFEMITYGKGGWTYDTLYNMPIRLRSLNFQWMRKALEAESSAIQKAQNAPPRTKKKGPP